MLKEGTNEEKLWELGNTGQFWKGTERPSLFKE